MANKRRVVFLLASLLGGVIASCAPENPGSGFGGHRGSADAGEPSSHAAQGGEPQHYHQDFAHFDVCSDAEVGAILSAVDKASINVASAVMSKTADPEMRSFAERVIREHKRLDEIWTDALARTGVKPKESRVSRDIEAETRTTVEAIEAETPGPETEVQLAKKAVAGRLLLMAYVNHFLIPSTDNELLREALKVVRATVATELISAVNIEQKVGGGCSAQEEPPPHGAVAPQE